MAPEPQIVFKPAFTVVGLSQPVVGQDGNTETLWEVLGARYSEISQADPDVGFGVHTWSDSGHQYLAGLALRGGVGEIPGDMAVFKVDAHTYAVFAHTGLVCDLPGMVAHIYDVWLPTSGYERAGNFYFEYYDDRFMPGSPDSVVFLFVPVVPRI